MTMLYERWREIAKVRGREIALRDLGAERAWTFAQLLDESDRSCNSGETWAFPRGNGAEFVLEVLRGWRHGLVVCSLEATDPTPNLPTPPRDIAHVKRTSATTGAARHVLFTADQIAADAANIVATMGLRPEWPNLGAISLAHSYGFSNLVLPLLLHGIPLFIPNSPLPEALRTACAASDAFTLAGVPALWRAWNDAHAISPKVKLAISAGAALPLALEREVFERTGVKIHNFLGASECGGIGYDRSATPRTDATLVGSAMESVSLSVTDGLLEVRGPAVGQQYWPDDRSELHHGVFRTSDLVEIRDGLLHVRGRAGDVIHIAGRKVAPEDIERVLLQHPAVKNCLVFDTPRADGENQIVAIVAAPKSVAEEIRSYVAHQIPMWQLPRQWRFVVALEANERGKLSRALWRQKFSDGAI